MLCSFHCRFTALVSRIVCSACSIINGRISSINFAFCGQVQGICLFTCLLLRLLFQRQLQGTGFFITDFYQTLGGGWESGSVLVESPEYAMSAE